MEHSNNNEEGSDYMVHCIVQTIFQTALYSKSYSVNCLPLVRRLAQTLQVIETSTHMGTTAQCVKGPDALFDVKTILFRNKECLIASFGTETRIYNDDREMVSSFRTKDFVHAILPCEENYFLLGSRSVYTCRDGVCVRTRPADWPWKRMLGIERVGDTVVLFYAGGYQTGVVCRDELNFSATLNDSAFYQMCSFAVCDVHSAKLAPNTEDSSVAPSTRRSADDGVGKGDALPAGHYIYAIAKTFSKSYLFCFNSSLAPLPAVTRRRIRDAIAVFSYRGNMYLIDGKGIWRVSDSVVLIRAISSVFLTCVYVDIAGDRVLLFCGDGSVTELAGEDLVPRVVLSLAYAGTTVARLGQFYLVGSVHGHFWLDSDYTVLECAPSMAGLQLQSMTGNGFQAVIGSNKLIAKKSIKMHCIQNASGMDRTDEMLSDKCTSSIQLRRVFCVNGLIALCYDSYSILNGQLFAPIKSVFEIACGSVLVTEAAIYYIASESFRVNIRSLFSRRDRNTVYTYSLNMVHAIDVENRRVLCAEAPADTYDIVFNSGEVFVVLSDATTRHIPTAAFKSQLLPFNIIPPLEKSMTEIHKEGVEASITSSHQRFYENCPHKVVSPESNYVALGSCVYQWDGQSLQLISDFNEYISSIVSTCSGLFVQCLDNTYHYSCSTRTRSALCYNAAPIAISSTVPGDEPASVNFIWDNDVFALEDLSVDPTLHIRDLGLLAGHSSLYADGMFAVSKLTSPDQKSFQLFLNNKPSLVFEGQYLIYHTQLDLGFIALLNFHLEAGHSSIVLVRIGTALKIVQTLKETLIPITCTWYKNEFCAVFADRVIFYTFATGKLKAKKALTLRCDHVVKAWYAHSATLLLQDRHSGFMTIDTSNHEISYHNTKEWCLPFVLDNKLGWASGSQILIGESAIDLREEVAQVLALDSMVIVICVSGRMYWVEEQNAT